MREEDKKRIEYVIGIDLGHGETSAAICPMQWDTPTSQLDAVKDLEMGGNKKVIPSAITILDDGRAFIGDAAFNPEVLKQADVHVCFKKAPKNIDGENEKVMIRFMKEVYNRIRENNAAMLTDTNHLVYIATPSGWDKATQNLYVDMARKAGLPIAGVTKESRAAFVRAQHDTTSGLGRNIEKGAIVFDMGSSTLDFTYMNIALDHLIDHGYDCGASAIEKSIYSKQRQEEDSIQQFEKRHPRIVDYLVFEARKVKEQVYFDPSLRVKKTINFDDIVDDEELEDERFKLVFQPGELNQYLKENGYIQKIENAMLDYRQNHIPGQNIYGVFMTGGASRMDFLIPIICQCFGVEERQVYRDQDPSLTISQGVAEVARLDLRTEGMDTGLAEEIDNLINSDTVYDMFIEKFGFAIWDKVTDDIAGVLNYFKDATDDYSLANLDGALEETINDAATEVSGTADAYIQEAINECTAEIRNRVDEIVSAYNSEGTSVAVPQLKVPHISVPSIKIENVLDDIISEIATNVVQDESHWAAGAATGAAIGSFIPGIGTLIGAGIGGLWGHIAGIKGDDERRAEAYTMPLNLELRHGVYNRFGDRWEDIKSQVEVNIRQSLASTNGLKKTISQAMQKLLVAYKENLKTARILVD